MSGPYVVYAADRCGVLYEEKYDTFKEALVGLAKMEDRYPGPRFHVALFNEDRADLDNMDGLTEEEQEALEAQ